MLENIHELQFTRHHSRKENQLLKICFPQFSETDPHYIPIKFYSSLVVSRCSLTRAAKTVTSLTFLFHLMANTSNLLTQDGKISHIEPWFC